MDRQEAYILQRGFSANTRLAELAIPPVQRRWFHLTSFHTRKGGKPSSGRDWNRHGVLFLPLIFRQQQHPLNLLMSKVWTWGNSVWLIDAARYLPSSARIDGFDTDTTQCPPKEWLPSNVSIYNLDCCVPFPDHLIGKYDIVHVQLFRLAFDGANSAAVITNLISLLKPGGWISWGELDYSELAIVKTEGGKEVGDDLLQLWEVMGTLGGTKPSWAADGWVPALPDLFRENGLVNVAADNRRFPLELLPQVLDVTLMSAEEISYKVLDRMQNGSGDHCRALIARVHGDRQKAAYNAGRLTVVGQRPLTSSNVS
ncbi:S-adenosyl-L-methionine-dependent methyltransferase [Xylariaceae sp. FL1651]|nr:S-adenosyl-L-methionine-dependent methyltransferase [Xylariaceae sp. FL1651]